MNYINHQPLENLEDDKLSFNDKASQIAEFIENFPLNQPYSIAIFGNWGSGKSTMMNFIKQKLDENKNEAVEFNPWQILNEEDLVSTLFEELAYTIEDKYKKLKNNLIQYARKICVSGINLASKSYMKAQGAEEEVADSVGNASSILVDSLFNTDKPVPLSAKKDELEKELQNWSQNEGKKIVIFIDEVDRLFPAEMVEIFKVIKVALSFPSVIFVVAMDKQSVADSLNHINISRSEEYLTKIFQQHFYININYQLQTLFRELLVPVVKSFPYNPRDTILEAIEPIIFLKKDKFYSPNRLGGKDQEEISSETFHRYHDLYRALAKNLSVPRNFINYLSFVESNWVNYYNELAESGKLNNRDANISFLIFTLFYIHPEMVEIKYIMGSKDTIKEDFGANPLPRLFSEINMLLKNHLIERKIEKQGKDAKQEVLKTKFLEKAIYTLKKHPDFRTKYEN